jgi:YbbR domain-containing protein
VIISMKIRPIVAENWGIKLISLGLSLTLWFYVTSKGKTEMTLTVPLELRNIPQNMTVVGPVASSLEVRVQGQERVLRDITSGKKIVGILDLSMTKEGENLVRLSPDDISRPSEVAVTHMSLSEVKVRLEPLIQKSLRLRPIVNGSPARGYRLKSIVIAPQKVTVEGPASVVKMLDSLQTMPIDIQGAAENRSIEPKIDYQGQSVKLLDKNIEVRIIIERMNR